VADIAGFWSYVHADNEAVGNAIAKLAERLMSEFELLSAERLRLFVDRDLEWGEEWKGRIDRELQETTFFIPIITPRYFRSEECRRELVKFKSAADRFGVRQLLLPIYYVTVPEMGEREPKDELMAFVKSIQREDMRKVRLAEEWDASHRTLVNRLATKLLKISRETEGLSMPPDEPVIDSAGSGSDGSTFVPGMETAVLEPEIPQPAEAVAEGSLDVLAAGEKALAEWAGTVEDLNNEIKRIGTIAETSTPSMAAADSFAAKLGVANKLAVQLDGPAENLTQIAQDYSTHLITIDPAIQTLIENARTDEVARHEKEAKELFSVILGMVQASRKGAEGIAELIVSMEEPAAASRELRQRMRKIQTSLRNIADGQKILNDWEAEIRDVYGDSLRNASTA
jgi:hypothetical protein